MLIIGMTIAGPVTAFLHEYNIVSIGPQATFWPIFTIVVVAGIGMIFGIKISSQYSKYLQWLAVIFNGIVLLFYGFLLLFFGLGGSR